MTFRTLIPTRTLMLTLGMLLSFCLTSTAQNQLSIGDISLAAGTGEVLVTMTSDVDINGFVLAVAYSDDLLQISSLGVEGTVVAGLDPDGVFPQVIPGGFLLGVFFDSTPPFSGAVLPPQSGTAIARFLASPSELVDQPVTIPFEFLDGLLGSPPASNQLLQPGGGVIDASSGLALISGSVTIEPGSLSVTIADTLLPQLGAGSTLVLLDNALAPIDGYSITIAHDPAAISLAAIDLEDTDAGTAGPEMVLPTLLAASGTLDVVFDAVPPFDGDSLAMGGALSIANFHYQCDDPPLLPAPDETSSILLLDGTFDLSGGQVTVATTGATVTCPATQPPIPPNTSYWVGAYEDGVISAPQAAPGQSLEISFLWADVDSELQAVQLAVTHHCDLQFTEEFDIVGSVFDGGYEVEFIAFNTDDDPSDGDGCEFVCGILLDALPPFLGQTLPATSTPLLLGHITVTVSPTAIPGISLPVEFVDGINGDGGPFIDNIVVIEFESVAVLDRYNTAVAVLDTVPFLRGDTNDDGVLDISDCVVLLEHFYAGGAPAGCFASCDTNADGSLDLADFFTLANRLFLSGPAIAPPAAGCGISPTEICEGYQSCP